MATLTYDQAIEQAVTLRNQGQTYPQITQHLKKVGYISPHSNRPVTHMAVRAMIARAEKEGKPVGTANVGALLSPKADLLGAIRAITSLEDVGVDTRLSLIQVLLKTTEAPT